MAENLIAIGNPYAIAPSYFIRDWVIVRVVWRYVSGSRKRHRIESICVKPRLKIKPASFFKAAQPLSNVGNLRYFWNPVSASRFGVLGRVWVTLVVVTYCSWSPGEDHRPINICKRADIRVTIGLQEIVPAEHHSARISASANSFGTRPRSIIDSAPGRSRS